MQVQEIDNIIQTNTDRNNQPVFDPFVGIGAPLKRAKLVIPDFYIPTQYVPTPMLDNSLVQAVLSAGSIHNFITLLDEPYSPDTHDAVTRQLFNIRCQHDFCFWAASCAKIKNKEGGANIPFVLNKPQRKLIEAYEVMRTNSKPIRLILLKARQWGGSTATQLYMAWIQLCHREGWYSSIVAQDSSTARKIKAMYAKLLDEYDPSLLGLPDNKLEFGAYEGSQNDYIIKQNGKVARDSVISLGSVLAPNSIRGGDIAMCHFSEVGLWKDTPEWNASNIIRAVAGAILDEPMTMIVYESTANGTGNFFHDEWCRACKPANDPEKSDMFPLFIPWFDIELYQKEFNTPSQLRNFAQWLWHNKDNDTPTDAPDAGKYYFWLWQKGATLQNINWYISKRRTFSSHADMAAEYPSDDIEAFKHSGSKVFDIYKLEQLRQSCSNPDAIGEIYANDTQGKEALTGIHFTPSDNGLLSIWEYPDTQQRILNRYLVIVDPNRGISESADFADILVIDRYWRMYGGHDTIVAEWHGRIDKDLLAWKAAQIAIFYANALLVIERNTYDQAHGKSMDEADYIIDIIAEHYPNMYAHEEIGKVRENSPIRYGFHTNSSTKPAIIHNLIKQIREASFTERSYPAIDEMLVYEQKENGSWGAMDKHNDDRVITRAIGLWISSTKMEQPRTYTPPQYKTKKIKQAKFKL